MKNIQNNNMSNREILVDIATNARNAYLELSGNSTETKNKALLLASTNIKQHKEKILEANKENNKDLKNDLKIELNKPNKYVDINNSKNAPSLNIPKSNEINIFIDEQRRIFNEEIHYFDHPLFGLILSIKEI